jgi:O-antigen/teichoic acid export membrane protein
LGIILKQTVKASVFTYTGAFLGFLTVIYLQPNILKENNQIGIINILVQYMTIFAQFGSLGFDSITNRLFPYFRDIKNKHNGFLFVALITSLAGFFIILIIFLFVKPLLLSKDPHSAVLLSKYIYFCIPLIFFTLFFTILDSYYRMLYNAVKGAALKEFFQKIFIFVPLGLFYFKYINFSSFVLLYVASICLPTLILVFSLIREKQFFISPKLNFINRDLRNSMISVGLFGLLASSASTLITAIDKIMVQKLLNLDLTAIYSTTANIALIISIPYRSLVRISTTIVSEAFKENNLKVVSDVYYKSCTVQSIIASLLFIGIWANIDNIFRILPPGRHFEDGKYVILFICIANLIDMSTGLNSIIISSSKYYKFITYFTICLIFLNIGTILIFIPVYGIVGVAVATAISMLVYNLLKYVFLLVKFKMQPYNIKHLLIIFISIISYFSVFFIPFLKNTYLDIAVRSSIILFVFGVTILFARISDDVNNFTKSIYNKYVKNYLGIFNR